MKKIKLIIISLMTIGFFAYAGGDIAQVTAYESNDINMAIEEAIPYVEERPIPTPIPTPIETMEIITKKPETKKDIIPSGFYTALGISGSNYNDKCKCETTQKRQKSNKDTNIALLARVGYDFNQYIGLEARGLRSVVGDNSFEMSHFGLFIKPMIAIDKKTNIYGLLGLGRTKVIGDVPNVSVESFAFGGGVELDLSKDIPKEGRYSRDFDGNGDQEKGLGLFLDYERLIVEKDVPNIDTVSAGVTYDF